MFNNSTLFRTSFSLVKTVLKVRGFEKDIGKRCVFDLKTTDEDISMNLIRSNKVHKIRRIMCFKKSWSEGTTLNYIPFNR
jgi:hypothetical protein